MLNKQDYLDMISDRSLKNVSRPSCMFLSTAIENGFMLSANPNDNIVYF